MSPAEREAQPDPYETPTRRLILLGVAFAALVAIGVMTVLRPELEQEPEQEPDAAAVADDTPAQPEPRQPAGPSAPVAAP